MQKERRSVTKLYLHESLAKSYLGEDKLSFQVEKIVKEDENYIVIEYENRGKIYQDSIPKQFCVVSKGTETPEGAQSRVVRVQALKNGKKEL